MREYLCEFYNDGGVNGIFKGIFKVRAKSYEKAMKLGEKFLKSNEIIEYYGECAIIKTIDLTDVKIVE